MTVTLNAELGQLADLIKTRNAVDAEIAAIIDRPAAIGHLGEHIASEVFRIILEEAANAKYIDGRFALGLVSGMTVNIKWYTKMESLLDVHPTGGPDFYLVLAGPKGEATTSRGKVRPMLIESVYLFEALPLVETLRARGVQIGTGTSVIKSLWEAAEIFPTQRNLALVLTDEQRTALALFGATTAIPESEREVRI